MPEGHLCQKASSRRTPLPSRHCNSQILLECCYYQYVYVFEILFKLTICNFFGVLSLIWKSYMYLPFAFVTNIIGAMGDAGIKGLQGLLGSQIIGNSSHSEDFSNYWSSTESAVKFFVWSDHCPLMAWGNIHGMGTYCNSQRVWLGSQTELRGRNIICSTVDNNMYGHRTKI